MTILPYQSIKQESTERTMTNTLARLIDGMGFRYRWATEELTDNEIYFRPVESSMNMYEVLTHIYEITAWNNRVFGGVTKYDTKPENFEELRERTLNYCLELSNSLKKMEDIELANLSLEGGKRTGEELYFHMISGPIADGLTHIGQITSWRRIAGNPQVPGVNLFEGKKS